MAAKKILLDIILWLWQLPQNLLGLLLGLYFEGADVKGEVIGKVMARVRLSSKMSGGISLGKYVYISPKMATGDCVQHELGHCQQSLILGPLYLLIIGLPSILWAGIHTLLVSRWTLDISYYWFYTERWANKLGGLKI